jgi:hypothetical protein
MAVDYDALFGMVALMVMVFEVVVFWGNRFFLPVTGIVDQQDGEKRRQQQRFLNHRG